METSSSLSFLLSLPLIAAALAFLVPKGVQRLYAIAGSMLFLALTIYETAGVIFAKTTEDAARFISDQHLAWIPEIGVQLGLRLDSLSAWFVVLNALVALVAFSLRGPWYRKSPRLFTALGFFLVFALNAAFLSTDLITFYLAYEAVFIPMIFIVGIWGENQKATAVFRFFLMSFLGSILMLVSMFYLIFQNQKATGIMSAQVVDLVKYAATADANTLCWVFCGFFLAFAIKVPMVPFHGWLKEVYVNSPMPGTIWMSAILSKLGVVGMLKFVLPLFGAVALKDQGILVTLSAVSVVYAALLAIRSEDGKSLLAYSSISHLGFVMLGVFTLRANGSSAAVLLSIGHTLVSALLFYLFHQVQERQSELGLETPKGLAKNYPILFTVMFVSVMASVSLPGTLNFSGEFLVLLSAYPISAICTILAGIGVIFGAVYMLKFYQQLGLGLDAPMIKSEGGIASKDLSGYDLILMILILGVIIYGGFQPAIFLKGN